MGKEGGRTPPVERAAGRRPVKIAYVLPNLERGGTESQLLALLELLDPGRYRSTLLTTSGGGGLLQDFRDRLPVQVHGDPQSGLRFRSSPGRHLRALFFLVRELRRERPDILHASLPEANLLGSVAARLAGVPRVVISKRSLACYKARHPRLSALENLGNRLADVILVNSDAVRRDVERTERFGGGKIRKVYNGVAPMAPWSTAERESFRRREGIAASAPVVLAVSNFYPYKGHHDLVEAFAAVTEKFPEALLLLAGRDAGTMAAVRAAVAAADLDGAVRFAGERRDVPDLLRAADLFVHPSREEGFSNVILEAMSAGKAVVACRAGGNDEAVADGVTGLLVPAGRADLLGRVMVELLGDTARRMAMEEAARERAGEKFSLGSMAAGMTEIYDSLTGRGPV